MKRDSQQNETTKQERDDASIKTFFGEKNSIATIVVATS